MIPISQITSDFMPYQAHPTILWGNGSTCERILQLLKKNSITPVAIVDSNWNSPVNREHIPVISPSSLHEFGDIETFIIQMAVDSLAEETQVLALLSQVGYFTVISALETWNILHFMTELDENFKNPEPIQFQEIHQQQTIIEEMKLLEYTTSQLENELILLCMPPKTGDHTIINTFSAHQIPHHFVFHKPESIPLDLLTDSHPKVKIITAIRDPIAENMSLCFQILGDLKESLTARFLLSGKYSSAFFENGGNLQEFYQLFLNNIQNPQLCGSPPIQNFISSFQNHILDYLKFPFDQEKGYGICQKGNVSIFVYQLEKLNDLLPELSEFVEKPISSLTIGNSASQKWIGKTYLTAQKELKFSKKYFEDSYNTPWVKHFYSCQDIEKFKEKWHNNIE